MREETAESATVPSLLGNRLNLDTNMEVLKETISALAPSVRVKLVASASDTLASLADDIKEVIRLKLKSSVCQSNRICYP